MSHFKVQFRSKLSLKYGVQQRLVWQLISAGISEQYSLNTVATKLAILDALGDISELNESTVEMVAQPHAKKNLILLIVVDVFSSIFFRVFARYLNDTTVLCVSFSNSKHFDTKSMEMLLDGQLDRLALNLNSFPRFFVFFVLVCVFDVVTVLVCVVKAICVCAPMSKCDVGSGF